MRGTRLERDSVLLEMWNADDVKGINWPVFANGSKSCIAVWTSPRSCVWK